MGQCACSQSADPQAHDASTPAGGRGAWAAVRQAHASRHDMSAEAAQAQAELLAERREQQATLVALEASTSLSSGSAAPGSLSFAGSSPAFLVNRAEGGVATTPATAGTTSAPVSAPSSAGSRVSAVSFADSPPTIRLSPAQDEGPAQLQRHSAGGERPVPAPMSVAGRSNGGGGGEQHAVLIEDLEGFASMLAGRLAQVGGDKGYSPRTAQRVVQEALAQGVEGVQQRQQQQQQQQPPPPLEANRRPRTRSNKGSGQPRSRRRLVDYAAERTPLATLPANSGTTRGGSSGSDNPRLRAEVGSLAPVRPRIVAGVPEPLAPADEEEVAGGRGGGGPKRRPMSNQQRRRAERRRRKDEARALSSQQQSGWHFALSDVGDVDPNGEELLDDLCTPGGFSASSGEFSTRSRSLSGGSRVGPRPPSRPCRYATHSLPTSVCLFAAASQLVIEP
eukprot:COSAG01_NODE_1131_length_11572_cov_84.273337_14_plen_449_part_00